MYAYFNHLHTHTHTHTEIIIHELLFASQRSVESGGNINYLYETSRPRWAVFGLFPPK